MKLSKKAIARMSGYRIDSTYAEYPNKGLKFDRYFWWLDPNDECEKGLGRYKTEEEAYEACCADNNLIEDEDNA